MGPEKEMAPQVGFEPTTLRLTAGCSAIELLRSVVCERERSGLYPLIFIIASRRGGGNSQPRGNFRFGKCLLMGIIRVSVTLILS